MKPLYLKIAGLHSFRQEQSIDFTRLCETGIFGIFGPTGSGKSTVLDGITLALYGKVERAKGGTQGIINQNEDKAYVHFAFSLGKRIFRAERTYKKSADNGVNLQQCRLIEVVDKEEVILAEKKKDMEDKVQEILGLNVTDFTRAVVLPQGKFAEFLTLQGTERRKMLQRLFGLEQYGEQLSQKIRGNLLNVTTELDKVQGRQSELGDASGTAVKGASQVLREQQARLDQLKQRDKELKLKDDSYKEIIKLQQELEELKAKKETLEEQKPAIVLREEKYSLAIKANDIKPFLDRVNNEHIFLDETQKELIQLEIATQAGEEIFQRAQGEQITWQERLNNQGKELEIKLVKLEETILREGQRDKLNQSLVELRQEYKALEKEHSHIQDCLTQLEASRLELAIAKTSLDQALIEQEGQLAKKEEILVKREAWQDLQQTSNLLEDLKKEQRAQDKQLLTVSADKRALEEKVKGLEKLLGEKEQELTKISQKSVTQLELNKSREDLNSLDKVINSLEHHYQQLHGKQQRMHNNYQEINKLKANLNQYSGLAYSLNKNREQLTQEITKLEKKHWALERSNLAYFLRQSIVDQEPCPVCGSLDHPQPIIQGVEDGVLLELKAAMETKKGELHKLEGDITNINSHQTVFQTQLTSVEATNKQLKQEEEQILGQIAQIRQQVREDWSQINLEMLKAIHGKELGLLNQMEKELQYALTYKESLNNLISQQRNELGEIKEKLAAVKATETALEQGIASINDKINKLSQEQAAKIQHFQKLTPDLPGEEIEGIYQNLNKLAKETEKIRKEQGQVVFKLEEVYQLLLEKNNELRSSQSKLDSLKTQGKNLSIEVQQLTEQINLITNGKKALEAQNELQKELDQLHKSLALASETMEEARLRWDNQKKLLHSCQDKQKLSESRYIQVGRELEEKLQEYGFVSTGEIEGALCTKDELEQLKNEIEQFKEEITIVQKNLASLQKSLGDRRLSSEAWQQFLVEKAQSELELEESKELVHKLSDRLEVLEKNHLRWKELEEERVKLTELVNKYTQLDKLFRGNTFVEFISEEQLMNVALDASRRLGELTQFRYGLEVDSEGGFIIRDDGNGGLRRPVTTLSGGETFLTSLALALALSSQIQLRGQYPLEFFFLDEGFGTLDSYLLETVINSLERLHAQNMTIGVISHVPELKARMARRLAVTAAEKGGQGSILALEYN